MADLQQIHILHSLSEMNMILSSSMLQFPVAKFPCIVVSVTHLCSNYDVTLFYYLYKIE